MISSQKLRAALSGFALAAVTAIASPSAGASSSNYFSTLPPHAPLPSSADCAARIPSTRETKPNNDRFNHTVPSPAQLAYFHLHPTAGSNLPIADFLRVDGNYTGSTDMILRWAACKWGIDENLVRAQAWTENKWIQGAPDPAAGGGDKRFIREQCVRGDFDSLWNFACENCCYQSWGILQTKVYYAPGTWPMIKDSTAFNADYRYAEERACINGDASDYFASTDQQPNTYALDVNSGNFDRVVWGCTGMHFSGSWYDPGASHYIAEIKDALTRHPWPTP